MTTTVNAVYENGVFKPEEPVALEEKAKVRLTIETTPAAPQGDEDPTGWKTARELVGCITEELVAPDVALNHDRYIYRRDR